MRPPRLGVGVRAVPRLCIKLCPAIHLTTEENHGKTSVRAAEKCLANHCRARFVWSTWPPTSGGLDWSAGARRSRLTLRATGPTLGQSKYLPGCRKTYLLPTDPIYLYCVSRLCPVMQWAINCGLLCPC